VHCFCVGTYGKIYKKVLLNEVINITELFGWVGFLLFASTLVPYFVRRLKRSSSVAIYFARYHHSLAITSLVVLTTHGILALIGRGSWHWGKFLRIDMLTGVISWLGLLVVVILATFAIRQKPFSRSHCWLALLLVVAVLFHIS